MKFRLIIYFTVITGLMSCSKFDDYLNKAETGGLTEKEVFGDYVQTESYLANIYAALPNDWMPNNSFTYAAASDEAKCPVVYYNGPQVYTRGLLSPTFNPIDTWAGMYAAIRKANLFLSKIDGVPTVNTTQVNGKNRMKGEGYFLRAWFFSELFKRYGGVPLLDRVLQISDDLAIPRNTPAEVVKFITDDCDRAAALLLLENNTVNTGRATKGAALMLKARTLLFAASLIHNPAKEVSKWQAAADAAKAVIDLNIYHVDGDYTGLFHKRNTPNIIFQSTVNNTTWLKQMFVPSQSGTGWVQPLQNLVDDYEMKDGKMITEDGSTYDPANPYANRDPRLAASIIYNGSQWKGATIQTYVGGADGLTSAEGSLTQTGYYLRKMLDENGSVSPDNRPGDHYWIYMRYEETLLDYAEALNEVLSAPDQVVYQAVNDVRTRTGVNMPALPQGLSKAQMREKIRHERRIELAFEGHRFWDLRRWRIGMQVMTNARGMRVVKTGENAFTYTPFLIESRVYQDAFDLYPIPQSERNRNAALSQNEGYN
jgi:hypothetical protein